MAVKQSLYIKRFLSLNRVTLLLYCNSSLFLFKSIIISFKLPSSYTKHTTMAHTAKLPDENIYVNPLSPKCPEFSMSFQPAHSHCYLCWKNFSHINSDVKFHILSEYSLRICLKLILRKLWINFCTKMRFFRRQKILDPKFFYQTGDSHVLHQEKSRPWNLNFKM